ncbi:MAG: hypothetical protein GY870_15190 [archaeon]|nr:hypothetical protein [archaeon]
MSKKDSNENFNSEESKEEDYFIGILKKKIGNEFNLESDKKKDFKPYIIVDKREKRSGIISELEELGAIIVEETLDSGDYMLSSLVAVERKRGDDFYGSLFGGSNNTNIFDELIRLSDSVDNPMLIIEDFERIFKRGEQMISSLYGAMVSIATTLKIPIIPTRNIKDTALVLYRIAKQQQGEQIYHGIARRAPKTMSLKDRQAFFIEGLYNVGPTKASIILEEFETPINFITALMNTNILYTKTGNPKGIEGDLKKIKGLGWKFVEENKILLFQKKLDA